MHTTGFDKHRLAALQDGVYSIAMTLLVLELKLPALPDAVTQAQLWAALLAIWPKLLTWLLSFWALAIFWIGDVRAVASFASLDGFVLRLGLWKLALVSLLPFSTSVLGEHGHLVPGSALYALHILVLSSLQLLRLLYLQAHPDQLAVGAAALEAGERTRSVFLLACAFAAFGLAFWVPGRNMLALLPALAMQVFTQRVRRQHSVRASS